ncbi:Peptidase U32, partial [gut metagenome]
MSTQRSILNSAAVRYWTKLGVDRVVLGRETPMEAIEEICAEQINDIEAFIHGGMCISFSGRCVLSNHMTNRDANRGGCAQSCRWKYTLRDGEQELSDPDCPFSMSSRDLQAAD